MKSNTYTIDEGLEAVGFGRFQWLLLVLSGIGFFATTIQLISVSLLRAPLLSEWPKINNERFAILMSATFVGELIGGVFWSSISDRLGRRISFIGTASVASIFSLLGAFVPCFYTFAITRFLLGFAMGGSLAIEFVYFVEFLPSNSRGFRTTFIILLGICACTVPISLPLFCFIFLVFYTSLVGWLSLPNWRNFVFLCGIPYLLLFIGRLFWKWESPRFLLIKGKTEQAAQVLEAMAITNGQNLPIGELQPLILQKTVGFRSIIDSGKLLATVTISLLFFFQTFSYYGLTVWLRNFAIMNGIQNLSPTLTFIVIGLSELPGLALTTFLIERTGRRFVLFLNFFGSAICSAILLFVKSREAFLAVSSGSYFFIVGGWASLYITTPEVFPTTCRASAFAIAGSAGKMAGILSPHIFGYLWDRKLPPIVVVACISGCFTLAAIVSALLVTETSGKRLMDQ